MRRDRTNLLQNKTMSNETYKLRRMVLNEIYQFKTIVDLPRIEVRICESHPKTMGVGRYGTYQIWIAENCISKGRQYLRHVICHEIGHAVFSLRHNDDCPIMGQYVSQNKLATDSQIEAFLKRYASKRYAS